MAEREETISRRGRWGAEPGGEKCHTSPAGGRAVRGIDRAAARKHKRQNAQKPLVFPCCRSIDVPAARRPAPTGGGVVAGLRAPPRLRVLCVPAALSYPAQLETDLNVRTRSGNGRAKNGGTFPISR